MGLNTEQENAVQGILKAYEEGHRVVGIQGSAGVGKTFMLKEAIDRLGFMRSTAFTAPTHEACKQLKLDLPKFAEVKTIYSLAGMRVTDDQEEQFVVPVSKLDLDDYAVVVIDEVSMCGNALKERYDAMRKAYPNVLFILMGDRYQLRPPKNPVSGFFEEYATNPSFELKTNMRMHNDSPLVSTAVELVGLIDEGYKGTIQFDTEKSEVGNLYVLPLPKFNEAFRRAVVSDRYSPSAIVALAYTNKRVRQLNNIAREAIHGQDCYPWIIGEQITTLQPLQREGFTEVNTNASGTIIDIEKEIPSLPSLELLSDVVVLCDKLTVQFEDKIYDCFVPNQDEGEDAFKKGLQIFRNKANMSSSAYDWRQFHQYRLSVANLRHTYAMTAHKSQGKSFTDTVFVDAINMQENKPRPPDMLNLLNVAITRSKRDVIVAQRA